ncbi:hypothetical protein VMCG_09909 [Cytospora schulzeri]|uniref:Uncharacterized protein n=1 Tax=Cytospora schulzeri TaxID=448051 RepID=A0A423VEL2_9PEZI|nr:hypothetical protein VMCG_09909 [Valsa malicola]
MSPNIMAMDDDRRSSYNHCQPGHPKADRIQAKKNNTSPSMAKRPAYPLKNRYRSQPAGRATFKDTEAHSFDGPELCRKLLPRDCQEARGCKVRDLDKRNRCWNKKVYVGVVGGEAEGFHFHEDSGGAIEALAFLADASNNSGSECAEELLRNIDGVPEALAIISAWAGRTKGKRAPSSFISM